MNTSNAHKSFDSFLQPTNDLLKEKQNPPKEESEKTYEQKCSLHNLSSSDCAWYLFSIWSNFEYILNFDVRLFCLIIIPIHPTFMYAHNTIQHAYTVDENAIKTVFIVVVIV